MHKEILTAEQVELLPLFRNFLKTFGLVGGTAIAFHLGHRRSIDFDMFSLSGFKNSDIKRKILKLGYKIDTELVNRLDEFTFIINSVKTTFFNYPYALEFSEKFNNDFKLPNLITLAAMKAHALAQRAKWKDYVDLYFIIKDHYSVLDIQKKGKELFGNEFNEKIFRTQLAYFKDLNYSEQVVYMPGFEISEKIIKDALTKFSIK